MSVDIKLAVVLLTAAAVLLLYLSNKNQLLLKQRLSHHWQRLALLLLSTGLLFAVFHNASLVFFYLAQLMLQAALIPWMVFLASKTIEGHHG